VLTGRAAIQDFWQGAMQMGVKTARLESVEAEAQDQTAIETGRYILSGAGGQLLDQGKYLVVWQREDGQWKLHRDIWNTSAPAAQ
jgi:ketosteroid isomerase-like protein